MKREPAIWEPSYIRGEPYYEKFLESYRKNIGNDIEIHPDITL